MYPIAIAVVEAEIKESWTWFLECIVSDLGSHARHVRPTFISDRQKVSFITYITFLKKILKNFTFYYLHNFTLE
jgi:hypothetical protein